MALTRRARSIERVGARTRGKRCREIGPTAQREGGKERARTRAVADRWDPPVRRSGRACVLARLGWAEWAEIAFSFSRDFPNAFLFIFSMDFKSNSNPIQIQPNSNMCIKQKNNLGST
jgi:hypothetical protein